ncbi:hypothetical protein E3N88_25046 [Mikania micrantha]|uniref:Uncharacterized protein n=1 Tax=Mikania micrantha TaxID=192012 RepID=A0A5N6N6I8_9ASTR|nr:hypothetical protein E3N88_25046 [Mikania micrantha]
MTAICCPASFFLVGSHQTATAVALVFWAAINNQLQQSAVRRLGLAAVLVLLGFSGAYSTLLFGKFVF